MPKSEPDDVEPDDNASEDAAPGGKPVATPRRSRRVTWNPARNPGDGTDTVPTSDSDQVWGDADASGAQQSNDERLTADKPPHWG